MQNVTVGERLAQAQASGNPAEIRAALLDAKAAGADPVQIEQALAQLDQLSAASGSTAAGSPAEDPDAQLRSRAEALKKRGNDKLKDGTKTAARDALELFSAGLEVRCNDPVLNAQLHSNRAHVRMLLRQFVEAVDDCRKAIEFDSKNIKAYWRAAKASMHLDLCRNAVEFCTQGLEQSPNDADLIKLRDACSEKLSGQQKRRAEQSAAPMRSADFNADEAMAVQDKVNSLSEQIEILGGSIASKQRQQMRAKLTWKSVEETPPDTRLYQAVGRTFVLGERASLENSLNQTIQDLDVELPKLSKTRQELEKRRDDAERELREIVTGFQRHHVEDRSESAA
jgi:chaperonin cofactor prefoldin